MRCRMARSRRGRDPSDCHSQVPWREHPGYCGHGQVPVLGPGTTNDSQSHAGIGFEFLPVGNLLELVEARRIGGSRSEVMDENTVATPLELLRQKKSRGFLGNVGVRLVRNAQNRDRIAGL